MKKAINKKFSIGTLILLIITASYIAFIWIHSTMTASDSSIESRSVLHFLNNLLKNIGISPSLTEHIVRKSAHFLEFMLLGTLTFLSAYKLKKRFLTNLMPVGFVCLATAVTDEFIQYFSPGRSAEVRDVLLDFSGAFLGVLMVMLIISLIKFIRR